MSLIYINSHLRNILLTTIPLERTQSEITEIYQHLLPLPFFQSSYRKLGVTQLKNLINIMTIKSYQKDSIIIKQGNPAKRCYVIIEGHAFISVSQTIQISNGTKETSQIKSGEINPGQLFGEKGLIAKSQRKFSVIADQDSIIAMLDKKDYLNIFNNIILQEQNENYKIYRGLELFREKTKIFVEKFLFGMEKIEFKPNDYIVKQNCPLENIYIIKSGMFKLLHKHTKNKSIDYDIEFFCGGQEKIKDKERFTTERIHELRGEKKFVETKELFVYGKGEIIGDVELYYNKNKSLFTAITLETGCEAFYCSKDKFVNMLGTHIKDLKNIVERKMKDINLRLNTIIKFRREHNTLPEKFFDHRFVEQLENITNNKRYRTKSSFILTKEISTNKKRKKRKELSNIMMYLNGENGKRLNSASPRVFIRQNISPNIKNLCNNHIINISNKNSKMKSIKFKGDEMQNIKVKNYLELHYQENSGNKNTNKENEIPKNVTNYVSKHKKNLFLSHNHKHKNHINANSTCDTTKSTRNIKFLNTKNNNNSNFTKSESENDLLMKRREIFMMGRKNYSKSTTNNQMLLLKDKKLLLNLNSPLIHSNKYELGLNSERSIVNDASYIRKGNNFSPLNKGYETIYSREMVKDSAMKKNLFLNKDKITSMLNEKYSLLRSSSSIVFNSK